MNAAGISETGVLTISSATSDVGGQKYRCTCGADSMCYNIHGQLIAGRSSYLASGVWGACRGAGFTATWRYFGRSRDGD